MSQTLDLSDAELAKWLVSTSLLTGQFRLRSGASSSTYFDKFRFCADPALLSCLVQRLKNLVFAETEVLAGLELGGVPLATALSLETGHPAAFVRKVRKTYGSARIVEGADVPARRVCVIEDIVTTGGQIVSSVEALRAEGAIILGVLCVVNRGPRMNEALAAAGIDFRWVFHLDDLVPWMPL